MESRFPRVGVGAVVTNQSGQILLQQRNKAPERGCWSIPGGRVEFNERLEDAIHRELKEELGVETRVVKMLCVTDHIVPEDQAHWVSPAYLVEVLDGAPANLDVDSTKEIAWFDLSSLPVNLTRTTRNALSHLTTEPNREG